jgi:hypothetical protein
MYVWWFILAAVAGLGTLGVVLAAFFVAIAVQPGVGGYVVGVIVAILVVFGLVVGCVLSATAGGRNLNGQSCTEFADKTGYVTELIIVNRLDMGTCFVEFNGQLVPSDQLWAEMRTNG